MMERLGLWLEHRLKRWRFNIQRYGFGLFLTHHVVRILGMASLERRVRLRKEAILAQKIR